MKSRINSVTSNLITHLPSREDALPVYSIVIFTIFGWTLYRLFWYIPSWLEHLSISSILITAAYILSFALLESAAIFSLLCLFSLIFPRRLFRDRFVSQSCSIVILLGVGAYLFQRKVKVMYRLSFVELMIYPVVIILCTLIVILIFGYFFKRFEILSKLIDAFAEKMTVFTYVYLPLGLLGLLVVLIRNLINLFSGFTL